MNSTNFWDQSKGTWNIVSENSNYFRVIETALNISKNEKTDHVPNFNKTGTAFFIRCKDYCIRVSDKWGLLGDCQWSLDKDPSDTFIIAKIKYSDLKTI